MLPISAADPSLGIPGSPAQAQGFAFILQEFHEVAVVSLIRSFPSALLRVVQTW